MYCIRNLQYIAETMNYCVTVHTPLSREVFWHENAKIPRHTARIYAISINSVHREAVTENGVNSNLYVTAHGANRNNLPLIR